MDGFGWLIWGVIAFIMIVGGYFWFTDNAEKRQKLSGRFRGWSDFGNGDGDGGGDGGGGGNGGGGWTA